jgi:ABC-type Zn uptake system ZnuABC Zn-binding protein ZnuA
MGNLRTAGAVCLGLIVILLANPGMAEDRVRIGTSEFVYSDLAQQIGGSAVAVDLLDRQKIAAEGGTTAIAKYDLILCDGTAADTWLRDAARQASPHPLVLEATDMQSDSAPWYNLQTMSGLAQNLAKELTRHEPVRSAETSLNLARYLKGFEPIDARIAEIAKDYEGSEVFVTDDLFLGILARMHFKIEDGRYVKALQRTTKSTPASVDAVKEAISMRDASILLYDRDSKNSATHALVAAANDINLPVVGLREKLPTALHYQQWMLRQLNAVHGALNEAAP